MIRHRHDWGKTTLGLLFGVLVTLLACQTLAQPVTASTVADSVDNFTGTILFIHGRPQSSLPVSVAKLRGTCVSRLEAALRGRGHKTADRETIETLVMKWRIRGSHLVSREFLSEIHRDHLVGQVLVVTLLADNSRFLMTARMVDTRTGQLIHVDLKDVDLPVSEVEGLPVSPLDWNRVLDGICQDIVPIWSPPPPEAEQPMLVLPTRGIASDPQITSVASHSLLKTLLENGVALIDPALTEVTMIQGGRPSHWLDSLGRRLLLKNFDQDKILVSELASYDRDQPTASWTIFDENALGPGRRSLIMFSMTMRLVDLNTGTALRSAQIMHEKPPATGWFGNQIITTLLSELESTSHELWAAFSPEAKDD